MRGLILFALRGAQKTHLVQVYIIERMRKNVRDATWDSNFLRPASPKALFADGFQPIV